MRFWNATKLVPSPDGTLTGATSPDYWNLIGPFGGWIATVLMRGVLDHPNAVGAPLSASVSFAAAIEPGPFEVRASVVRANRSTTFWRSEIVQTHAGSEVSCAQASVVLATRRDTPSFRIAEAPPAPPPEDVPPWSRMTGAPAFLEHYDIRFVRGGFREPKPPETTLAWVRDRDADAPLDFPALLAFCDIGLPQIFYHARKAVPISTLVMNAFFHASAADLAAIGGDYLRYVSRMRIAAHGYFDMTTELWSRSGALLATTEQIVWYKIS